MMNYSSCHWTWTLYTASQVSPGSVPIRGCETHALQHRREKRHDRGGDVFIGYARRTCTGTTSCSGSTCVITTQLCTQADAAPHAVQELFRSMALLPLRYSWRVRQIAALRLTTCSRTSGTKGPCGRQKGRAIIAPHTSIHAAHAIKTQWCI